MKCKRLTLILLSIILYSCATVPQREQNSRFPAAQTVKASCSDLVTALVQGPESLYVASRSRLQQALKKQYSNKEVTRIQQNLDALHFIDYKHSIPELVKIYEGQKSLGQASLYKRYDTWGFFGLGGQKAFRNYEETFQFLQDDRPPLSRETLKLIHSQLMRGGIEDISRKEMGEFRTGPMFGKVSAANSIDKNAYKELENNPYISVRKLNQLDSGRYSGKLEYPHARQFTSHVENIIKRRDAELHRRLIVFRDEGQGNREELTRDMVNALTEDLLEWFIREKDQIGDLSVQKNLEKFTEVVAQFQRYLVSIHPFFDGNGRTSRMFALYYPFLEAGLPPPRLLDPDNDLYYPFKEWKDEVLEGVRASQELYSGLIERAEKGLPLENTPELLSPKIPKYAKIDQVAQSNGKRIENNRIVEISPEQFAEFFYQKLSQNPNLLKEIGQQGDPAYSRLLREYEEYLDISRIDFVHKKTGQEEVQLNFVDRDFMGRFGDQSFLRFEKWQAKMDRWYTDEILWRGLPSKNKEMNEDEILNMFQSIHPQYVSNNLMGKIGNKSERKAKELILQEFRRYNEDLVTKELAEIASDHSDTGPKYGISYGYSTSKKRSVGKAFAMGAMVVAEYGKQQDFQHLLKSRVLVGVKRAKKDVDLMRLHRLRDEFWYKYARQQEVMGIGASDPDSLMFVQTLDDQGEVIRSYVRNPEAPHEIFVINGEASAFPVKESQIERIIELK